VRFWTSPSHRRSRFRGQQQSAVKLRSRQVSQVVLSEKYLDLRPKLPFDLVCASNEIGGHLLVASTSRVLRHHNESAVMGAAARSKRAVPLESLNTARDSPVRAVDRYRCRVTSVAGA